MVPPELVPPGLKAVIFFLDKFLAFISEGSSSEGTKETDSRPHPEPPFRIRSRINESSILKNYQINVFLYQNMLNLSSSKEKAPKPYDFGA